MMSLQSNKDSFNQIVLPSNISKNINLMQNSPVGLFQMSMSGYFNLANESDEVISALRQRGDQLEKRELEQRIFDEYNSYFQFFLFPALLLILIEFLLHYRKNKYFAGKDLFKE